MKTLTITDETAAGDILHQISLQFEEAYITVKALIKARVEEEIERYSKEISDYRKNKILSLGSCHCLVLPTNLENRLNKKVDFVIDIEKQVYVAINAFQNNGFIILVDDEQAEDLNQKVLVDESTTVSFIKLTPLVGG